MKEELVEQLKLLIEDIRERKHISTLSRINYMRILTEVIEIVIQNKPEILSLSKPRKIDPKKIYEILLYERRPFNMERLSKAIATSKDIWKEDSKCIK